MHTEYRTRDFIWLRRAIRNSDHNEFPPRPHRFSDTTIFDSPKRPRELGARFLAGVAADVHRPFTPLSARFALNPPLAHFPSLVTLSSSSFCQRFGTNPLNEGWLSLSLEEDYISTSIFLLVTLATTRGNRCRGSSVRFVTFPRNPAAAGTEKRGKRPG